MKPSASTLLPQGVGSKIIAIFGYLVVALGIFFVIEYVESFANPSTVCGNGETISGYGKFYDFLLLGGIQLILSVGLVWLVRKLNSTTGGLYKTAVIVAAILLLVIQVMVFVGIGFTTGTRCA